MYSEHCRVWGSRVNHRAAVHVAGSLTPEREPEGCSGSGYQEWLEKIWFQCVDCDITEVRNRKRPRSVYWEDRTRKSHLSCELLPVAGHSSIGISMRYRQSLGGRENKWQFTAYALHKIRKIRHYVTGKWTKLAFKITADILKQTFQDKHNSGKCLLKPLLLKDLVKF